MNELNTNTGSFFSFKKKFLIKMFKASVFFKKPIKKVHLTRFRRKTIMRWKHQSNWLMYTNVIKLWSKDFMFYKRYLRFQFFNKLFINNFFLFNLNFNQMKNENYSYNCNFHFFTLVKPTFFYFNNNNNTFKFFQNNSILFAWYLHQPVFDNSIVPTYSEWDGMFFPFTNNKKDVNFDFTQLFDFFSDIILQQGKEIKKILTLLWYFYVISKR